MAETRIQQSDLATKLQQYGLNRVPLEKKWVSESATAEDYARIGTMAPGPERDAEWRKLALSGKELREVWTWTDPETKASIVAQTDDGGGNFTLLLDRPVGATADDSKPAPSGQLYDIVDTPNGKFWGVWNGKNYDAMLDKPASDGEKVLSTQHDDKTGTTHLIVQTPGGGTRRVEVPGGPKETPKPEIKLITGGDGKTYSVTFGPDGKPGEPVPVDIPGAAVDKYTNITEHDDGWYGLNKQTNVVEKLPGSPSKTAKPESRIDAAGRRVNMVPDPKNPGKFIEEVVPFNDPSAGAGGNPFPELSEAQYGKMGPILVKALNSIYANPKYTDIQKEQYATQAINAATLMDNEMRGILQQQGTTFRDETALHGQQLQEVQSRRALGANAVTTGMDFLKTFGKGVTDTTLLGAAFMQAATLPLKMAAVAGGMERPNTPKPGVALEQQKQVGLPQYGAAQSPQTPVIVNNITSPAGNPNFMNSAMGATPPGSPDGFQVTGALNNPTGFVPSNPLPQPQDEEQPPEAGMFPWLAA